MRMRTAKISRESDWPAESSTLRRMSLERHALVRDARRQTSKSPKQSRTFWESAQALATPTFGARGRCNSKHLERIAHQTKVAFQLGVQGRKMKFPEQSQTWRE
jgi:hypothetical protein